MTDQKKPGADSIETEKPGGATGPASTPPGPDELTDAELNSVAGGFAPMHIDAYTSTNFLEY